MLPNAEDLASGRWPDILSAAGVDSSFLTGRAGPCPFCGGTDRFVFQNKNGGRYLCRNCTEGKYKNGFDFLMRHLGYNHFKEAADHVRDFFGIGAKTDDPSEQRRFLDRRQMPPALSEPPIDLEKALARMNKVWAHTQPVSAGDPVDRYLRRRIPGLRVIPLDIQYHPELDYWNPPTSPGGSPILVGYFPAMVVRGFNAVGALVQIHKTYLTEDGHKAPVEHVKKTDRGVGSNSFALRLGWPQGDTLGVCEGIETGLASTLVYPKDIPVWPCHSSGILANFVLPEALRGQVRKLVIFADSDEIKNGKKAGSKAAADLANRQRGEKIRTLIVRPAKVGADMADLLSPAST